MFYTIFPSKIENIYLCIMSRIEALRKLVSLLDGDLTVVYYDSPALRAPQSVPCSDGSSYTIDKKEMEELLKQRQNLLVLFGNAQPTKVNCITSRFSKCISVNYVKYLFTRKEELSYTDVIDTTTVNENSIVASIIKGCSPFARVVNDYNLVHPFITKRTLLKIYTSLSDAQKFRLDSVM